MALGLSVPELPHLVVAEERCKRHCGVMCPTSCLSCVVQEKMKRMSPADREKYQAKKDKLERERRARKMGKTVFR